MKIEVELFMNLKEHAPARFMNGPVEMELSTGATMGDLVNMLGIPGTQPVIMLLDGKTATRETPLAEGVRVTLFPPLDGG